jgi:hypothetical protein
MQLKENSGKVMVLEEKERMRMNLSNLGLKLKKLIYQKKLLPLLKEN